MLVGPVFVSYYGCFCYANILFNYGCVADGPVVARDYGFYPFWAIISIPGLYTLGGLWSLYGGVKSCSSLQLVITNGLTKCSGIGTSFVDGWFPSPYLVCSRGSGYFLISDDYCKRVFDEGGF